MKMICRLLFVGIVATLGTQVEPLCGRNDVPMCDDTDDLDASFYMIHNLRPDNFEIEMEVSRRNHKHTYMHGERNCHTAIAKNNSTRCPVYYVLNYDANREPSMIAEARCSCQNCYKNATHASTAKCVPDYYYRPVLETDQVKRCQRRIVRRFQGGCSCRRTPDFREPY